jgi:opacity protein-like surface antigen
MFSHRLAHASLLVLAASVAPAAAFAADALPNVYVGASVGLRTNDGLDCNGVSNCDLHTNKSGKLVVGYGLETHQFAGNPTVTSVELMGYSAGAVTAGFHTAGGIVKGEGKVSGVGLNLASTTTVNDFAFTTRVGLAHSVGKVDYAAGGSDSKSANGLLLGMSVAYALDKNWSINAGFDYVPKVKFSASQSGHASLFSVGTAYRF